MDSHLNVHTEMNMPQREDMIFGTPGWIDLMTTDKKRAMAFYGALFGWTEQESGEEFGFYSSIFKDDNLVAGMMTKPDDMQQMPDFWSVYFGVEDAAATIEKAKAAGGQSMLDAMQVGDHGTMGMIGDPTGAAVGLWQPDQNRGFQVWGEPGAPAWFELLTRDLDAASAFYPQVFGVSINDEDTGEDGPPYKTIQIDGESYAGLMAANGIMPDEVPPYWTVYFLVEKTDEAVAKIQELGGSVITPPMPSPYGNWATVADPMGAVFVIVGD